jgi:EmrB/QacA subfamily drug resistance transporter
LTSETVDTLYGRYGRSYLWLATVTGVTASFTMVLTGTIANVAVPNVMGAFGVGQDLAQFLATAFIATMTASQLLNAWFVDTFGQRLAFTIVLAVFAAGGLLCAFSPTLDFIIVGRIMQGFSAGVVQPLVMVTILQVFPPERRGTAMGIYGMGLVLALGLGPVVGGIVIDALSWRYMFFVPLPLVAVAMIMGTFFMPTTRPEGSRAPFDWTGYLLLCTALYCVMSAIANGQREGWSSNTIMSYLLIGGAAAYAFIHSQLRADAALLRLSLFGNPRFAAAAVCAFVYGIGNFSTTYAVPVFGQLVQGLTPTAAGSLLLPASLVLVAIFPFTGWLADRAPPQYPLIGGFLLFVVGTSLLATADVNTAYASVVIFAMVGRLGMGFIMPSLMTAAIKALPPGELNVGSGNINFCRQLGGAFGINALVALMERRTQFHSDAITATQTADNAATRELLRKAGDLVAQSGLSERIQHAVSLEHLADMIYAQALTFSFQDGFHMIAAVFIAAVIPAYVLGRSASRFPRAVPSGHG